MFSLSPLEKISISVIAVGAIFFAGYYKGYRAENARFVDFKQKLEIEANAQKRVVEQIEGKQKIITEGIKNEYQARIRALELRYGRLHNGSSDNKVSGVPNTASGADEASPNLVLACAITTQQLVSLQEWIKLQKTAQ